MLYLIVQSINARSAAGSIMVASETVETFYRAWMARDVDACLALCTSSVHLSQHYVHPDLPFTGTTIGTRSFGERLRLIFAAWTFDKADRTLLFADATTVRVTIAVVLHHHATGERFDGSFRHIWVVRDGLITQCEEYIDLQRMTAFMALIKSMSP